MRALMLGVTIALGLAAGVHHARATPAPPTRAPIAGAATVIPVAHHCGQGQRWVPAGYAKHGKYRVGHCAPTAG